MPPIDFTNLAAVLTWLADSGGVLAVAALASWLAERWPTFQRLSAFKKMALMLGLSVFLTVGAHIAQVYITPEVMEVLAEYYRLIAGTVVVFLTTQLWHAFVNLRPAQATTLALSTTTTSPLSTTVSVATSAPAQPQPEQLTDPK